MLLASAMVRLPTAFRFPVLPSESLTLDHLSHTYLHLSFFQHRQRSEDAQHFVLSPLHRDDNDRQLCFDNVTDPEGLWAYGIITVRRVSH